MRAVFLGACVALSVASVVHAKCNGVQKFDDETGKACVQAQANVGPNMRVQQGNLVVSLREGKKFGVVGDDGATSYFPEAVDVLQETIQEKLVENNDALNAATVRLLRTERELGLDDDAGDGTPGGLGKLLGGLLKDVVKGSTDEQTQLNEIKLVAENILAEEKLQTAEKKLQTALLVKLDKNMNTLATTTPTAGASWLTVAGVLGSKLWRVSSGGEEIRVTGRNFLPDVPGLYVCKLLDDKSDVKAQAQGVAINTNSVSCNMPKWTGSLAGKPPKAEATLELWEDGQKLDYIGKDSDTVTMYKAPPMFVSIKELPACVDKGFCNFEAKKTFTVTVVFSETGDANKVNIKAESNNQAAVKDGDFTYGGTGTTRTVVVKFQKKKSAGKIGIHLIDEFGGKSAILQLSFTFNPSVGASLEKLNAYWSFDDSNDPSRADFAKSFKTYRAQSTPNRHPGQQGEGGNSVGKKGKSAYFNNQDHMRYDFYNSGQRVYIEKEFTISLWMKHNTCHNNQIPMIFGSDRTDYAGSFVDAHAGFRFCLYDCYFYTGSGANCERDKNKWQHWVVTSDGKKHVGYRDGAPVDYNNNAFKDWKAEGAYIRHFGSKPGWGTNGLGGYLDEVIVWDRGLSAAEVKSLYDMSAKDGLTYKANFGG